MILDLPPENEKGSGENVDAAQNHEGDVVDDEAEEDVEDEEEDEDETDDHGPSD